MPRVRVPHPPSRAPRGRPQLHPAGFTLMELMIAVTIMAILAAIAIPNYQEYVRRSRVVDATARLSDARVRMEQYFLDNRTFADGCARLPLAVTDKDSFRLACDAAARTYTVTATGISGKGMADFTYSIDQSNVQKTVSLPAGWSMPSTDCWATRKDGSCS